MKSTFVIIIVLLFLCSCGNNEHDVRLPDISSANKVKLYFKSDFDSNGRMNIISKEISDIKNVNLLKSIIEYDPFTYLYCTSTGSMDFYKDSMMIATMVFNTTPEYLHIAWNSDGKLNAIKLSEENAKIIEGFKN